MSKTIRPVPNHPDFRLPEREDLVPGAELWMVATIPTDDGDISFPDQRVRLDDNPIRDHGHELYVYCHYLSPKLGSWRLVPLSHFVGQDEPLYWIKIEV